MHFGLVQRVVTMPAQQQIDSRIGRGQFTVAAQAQMREHDKRVTRPNRFCEFS